MYRSTRNPGARVSFRDAVFQGLAEDGGLFVPVNFPDITPALKSLAPSDSFASVAAALTTQIFSGELSAEACEEICNKAFSFGAEISELGAGHHLLELYHGPSCAFKDFGASFLASSMEYFLQGKAERAIILTATSGDTGSAVAQAFHGKENIDVVILYPSGRVSPSQEKQLTTLGGNIHALEVDGSFDDCQKMVKEAFLDSELNQKFPLTSANSINLGRLLPQSLYYAYAWVQLGGYDSEPPRFCVPSGNFGNLTAGAYARTMGLPVEGFIAATNANDVVPEYLTSGVFTPRASVKTHANAMDVGNPSNFERLVDLFKSTDEDITQVIHPEVVNDGEILETMKRYYDEKGKYICPHTAVGVLAAERVLASGSSVLSGKAKGDTITLSTAHPAKFGEVFLEAGLPEPEMPQRLQERVDGTKVATLCGNTKEDLAQRLNEMF